MTRIYAVKETASGKYWLIEAKTPAQALRHVTGALFEVKPASSKIVADLMTQGAKVHNAIKVVAPKRTPEPEPETTTEQETQTDTTAPEPGE